MKFIDTVHMKGMKVLFTFEITVFLYWSFEPDLNQQPMVE